MGARSLLGLPMAQLPSSTSVAAPSVKSEGAVHQDYVRLLVGTCASVCKCEQAEKAGKINDQLDQQLSKTSPDFEKAIIL